MSEQIGSFLIGKGTLGVLVLLLIGALGFIWREWRADERDFRVERAALTKLVTDANDEIVRLFLAENQKMLTLLIEIKTVMTAGRKAE